MACSAIIIATGPERQTDGAYDFGFYPVVKFRSGLYAIAMGKTRVRDDLRIWIEARQRYHLTHAQVQMARELGMNPKRFGSLANDRQETWKLPLPQFIESAYLKRFHKARPETVVSLEERVREIARKKADKRERKQLRFS